MKKKISKELIISILLIIIIILYNTNIIQLSKLTVLGITLAGILITLDGIFDNYILKGFLYLLGLICICVLPNIQSLELKKIILQFCDDVTLTLMGMCFVFISLYIGKIKNKEIQKKQELEQKKVEQQVYRDLKENLKQKVK